jgi:hypothetical protein
MNDENSKLKKAFDDIKQSNISESAAHLSEWFSVFNEIEIHLRKSLHCLERSIAKDVKKHK